MTTIQKFGSKENHIHTDEKVIALVDEAHSTSTSLMQRQCDPLCLMRYSLHLVEHQ